MAQFLHIALLIVLSVLGVIGIVYAMRGRQGPFGLEGTKDIEGIYVTALAAFYGVFISFMILMVWGRYYDTQVSTEQEASTLAGLYQLAGSLEEPYRSQLQDYCVRYAEIMIKYEWPAMTRMELDREGTKIVQEMWTFFNEVAPAVARDGVVHDHLLTEYIKLADLRRYRLLQARTGLPTILYAALLFGAFLTIGLAVLFHAEPPASHMLKAAAITSIIVFLLYAIWTVDYPFQGDVAVPPTAFHHTLELMKAH
jgi:hypothetical protein